MASCQPLATALDNGRVILCDRIADPWVRILSLSLHGGLVGTCMVLISTSLGQPGLTAALTPPHTHTRTSHHKAPQTPLEPGGCLMQLSRDPRALSLQNAFWFSLGCCTFFLIPNIIFAIRLTKHFRPIRNRLM